MTDSPNNWNKIKIAICDIDGVLRGKYVSRDKFESIKNSNIQLNSNLATKFQCLQCGTIYT